MTIEEQKSAFEDRHRETLAWLCSFKKTPKNWRKERARWNDETGLETQQPMLKIEVESSLEVGEFWLVSQFVDGKWKVPMPLQLLCEPSPELFGESIWEGGMSDDASEYLTRELARLEKNMAGGKNAIHGRDYLRRAIEEIGELDEGILRAQVMKALEGAYRAGLHASEFDHGTTKEIASDFFEMEENKNKKGPRKKWIKAAWEFFTEHGTSSKWWQVLEYLKGQNIAYWEGVNGGECPVKEAALITFEDGITEDKTRKRFQDALSEVRKTFLG